MFSPRPCSGSNQHAIINIFHIQLISQSTTAEIVKINNGSNLSTWLDLPRSMTRHSQLSEFSDPPRFLLHPESRPDHSVVEEELEEKKRNICLGLSYL